MCYIHLSAYPSIYSARILEVIYLAPCPFYLSVYIWITPICPGNTLGMIYLPGYIYLCICICVSGRCGGTLSIHLPLYLLGRFAVGVLSIYTSIHYEIDSVVLYLPTYLPTYLPAYLFIYLPFWGDVFSEKPMDLDPYQVWSCFWSTFNYLEIHLRTLRVL